MSDIKDRIRKLLNLANDKGATEAEAESAMAMASALMLKYNITIDESKGEDTTITAGDIVGAEQGFSEMWHMNLASAAAYLYMCKNIRYRDYGTKFIGRPDNIDAAEQTWFYLIKQVEQQYKIHLPKGMTKAERSEYRRTFKYSCSIRVYNRAVDIMQQFRNNDAKAIEYTGSRALVLVATIDQQLKECREFMDKEFPDLKKGRNVARKVGSGSHDGYKAGEKVKLNHALKG